MFNRDNYIIFKLSHISHEASQCAFLSVLNLSFVLTPSFYGACITWEAAEAFSIATHPPSSDLEGT